MSTSKSNTLPKELNNAIAMLGDSHVLCILSNLSKNSMRFTELQRCINGLNPTTLTDRLKKLEKEDVIIRREEAVDKVSVVYELTEKGRGILPIIHELTKFGQKFM